MLGCDVLKYARSACTAAAFELTASVYRPTRQ